MEGYTVCFVRKDSKPEEIYYYHTFREAKEHLNLFQEDDSELYKRIEIRDLKENILEKIECAAAPAAAAY